MVVEGSLERAMQVLRAGTDIRGVELLVEGNTSTSPAGLVGGVGGQLGMGMRVCWAEGQVETGETRCWRAVGDGDASS